MSLSILIPSKNEPRACEMVEATINEFPEARVVVANDRFGFGKGWAVRTALTEAQGDVVCLIDGDLDIHPRMIHRLLPFLEDYDIVVGRKQVRGFLSRRILTHCSRLFAWAMFGLNIDTQTGIKVFKRTAIYPWTMNSFAFDLEMLAKAKQAGKTIIEVPVDVTRSRKMKWISIWRSFTEAIELWLRLHTRESKSR